MQELQHAQEVARRELDAQRRVLAGICQEQASARAGQEAHESKVAALREDATRLHCLLEVRSWQQAFGFMLSGLLQTAPAAVHRCVSAPRLC